MSAPSCQPRDSTIRWDRLVAVRNRERLWGPLSGSVEPGRALHVAGSNGCGKTTFLRALAGLHRPFGGCVNVTPASVCHIGHTLPLANDLTAADNLAQWASLLGSHTLTPEACAATLSELDVPARRPAGRLSAGQRRKLGLAVLVWSKRPVWLLDEPLDALDQRTVGWLSQLCRAHLQAHGTLIYTTHQPDSGAFPCTHRLHLPSGEVVPA